MKVVFQQILVPNSISVPWAVCWAPPRSGGVGAGSSPATPGSTPLQARTECILSLNPRHNIEGIFKEEHGTQDMYTSLIHKTHIFCSDHAYLKIYILGVRNS